MNKRGILYLFYVRGKLYVCNMRHILQDKISDALEKNSPEQGSNKEIFAISLD